MLSSPWELFLVNDSSRNKLRESHCQKWKSPDSTKVVEALVTNGISSELLSTWGSHDINKNYWYSWPGWLYVNGEQRDLNWANSTPGAKGKYLFCSEFLYVKLYPRFYFNVFPDTGGMQCGRQCPVLSRRLRSNSYAAAISFSLSQLLIRKENLVSQNKHHYKRN